MGRAIGGAIAAYVAIFIIVFVGLSVAWMVMGTDGAFKTATFNVSTAWVVAMLLVGVVAAVAGGWLASMIGKGQTAVMILAGIVLVLGLVDVITTMNADPGLSVVRMGDVSMTDAMTKAVKPTWLAVVNVVVGLAGVMVGGRLHGGRA